MVAGNQVDFKQEELLQAIKTLSLLDDNLMTLVFDRNIEAAELLLNVILERDDLKVLEVTAQREYKNPVPGGRSITIDIYAKDGHDRVYDVEVQKASAGADAHRARFHSSMIDTRMLRAGQEFKEIHDSYVIFITADDVIGGGHSLYHIDRVVQETGAHFGDGSHIIYVNGSYVDDKDPVGKLMHDFRCLEPADMFYPVLAESVKHFKETEGGQKIMSLTFEELLEKRVEERVAEEVRERVAEEVKERVAEEVKERVAEERAEEKKASARRMIEKGKMTAEEIAEIADLPIGVIRELAGLQMA